MNKMDKLIKQMLEIEPELVLGLEDYPGVYILPAIITKENCTDVGEDHIGEVEYQVSDGPVGERGTSFDVFTWDKVRDEVKEMDKQMS
jgi:hypothetical protein